MKKNSTNKINKIFCIGLNKTGTRSLHEAFTILGYRSVHYSCEKGSIKNIIAQNALKGRELLCGIEHFEAYSDWNNQGTNSLFIELDKQYPGSKFILNTRDLHSWIVSRERHVRKIPDLEKLQKEHPDNTWYHIDKEAWTEDYRSHHKQVLDYFRERSQDLLVLNVTKGDGWKKLCGFLDVPQPRMEFPFKNDSYRKKGFLQKIKNWIKKPVAH